MRVGVIGFLPGQHDPFDPGELVGKRNGDQAEGLFFRELPDPVHRGCRLVFDLAHHCGRPDDKKSVQVSVSLLRDAAKSGFATGRSLLRCQPEPCSKRRPEENCAASVAVAVMMPRPGIAAGLRLVTLSACQAMSFWSSTAISPLTAMIWRVNISKAAWA